MRVEVDIDDIDDGVVDIGLSKSAFGFVDVDAEVFAKAVAKVEESSYDAGS